METGCTSLSSTMPNLPISVKRRWKLLSSAQLRAEESESALANLPRGWIPVLAYIHIYIYIYTHVYIYIYTCLYIYIYIHTYMHTYKYLVSHIYIYIYTHTSLSLSLSLSLSIYIYIYIYSLLWWQCNSQGTSPLDKTSICGTCLNRHRRSPRLPLQMATRWGVSPLCELDAASGTEKLKAWRGEIRTSAPLTATRKTVPDWRTPNLPTRILPSKIRWLKISGKFPRIPSMAFRNKT